MGQGTLNVEDFVPYRGTDVGYAVAGTSGAALTEVASRHGVVNIAATAGTNAEVGLVVNRYVDLSDGRPYVVEAYVKQNADANSPQAFVGLSDQAGGGVYASGALAVGSNQDTLGLRWNVDETIDLVSVVDGAAVQVLKTAVATVARTAGFTKLGIRVIKETSVNYTVYCSVNGVVVKALTLTSTQVPQNPMKPVVATTVATSTAPSVDIDWVADYDKV
jgi:hypothetical protein